MSTPTLPSELVVASAARIRDHWNAYHRDSVNDSLQII